MKFNDTVRQSKGKFTIAPCSAENEFTLLTGRSLIYCAFKLSIETSQIVKQRMIAQMNESDLIKVIDSDSVWTTSLLGPFPV